MSSPTPVTIRSPTHYSLPTPATFTLPPLTWLQGSWSVTHSTLPMWRSAKNVRITYTILPGSPARLDDEVASEPIAKTWLPQPKSIRGIDTLDASGEGWNWRGRGWLKIASSRWEVLGWGENEKFTGEEGERWVVTYFKSSMFTPAGLDVYSSRKEGISEELYARILGALEGLESKEAVELVKGEMREVLIQY